MACPGNDFRTVSLGCFIEHDLAKACLRTAADVVRVRTGYCCSWDDIGYIIPQTTLSDSLMQELVLSVGDALFKELYIGYFGVDVVVFTDENGELSYWVVDIDPYYTDLLSFDDWRRFCLDVPSTTTFSDDPTIIGCGEQENRGSACEAEHRHVVCSGKLYVEGFASTSFDFFAELLKRNNIGYSVKSKTGCMICPIDPEKRAIVLFAFCRARKFALKYFIRALQALHHASIQIRKLKKPIFSTSVGKLARALKKVYNVKDEYSPI